MGEIYLDDFLNFLKDSVLVDFMLDQDNRKLFKDFWRLYVDNGSSKDQYLNLNEHREFDLSPGGISSFRTLIDVLKAHPDLLEPSFARKIRYYLEMTCSYDFPIEVKTLGRRTFTFISDAEAFKTVLDILGLTTLQIQFLEELLKYYEDNYSYLVNTDLLIKSDLFWIIEQISTEELNLFLNDKEFREILYILAKLNFYYYPEDVDRGAFKPFVSNKNVLKTLKEKNFVDFYQTYFGLIQQSREKRAQSLGFSMFIYNRLKNNPKLRKAWESGASSDLSPGILLAEQDSNADQYQVVKDSVNIKRITSLEGFGYLDDTNSPIAAVVIQLDGEYSPGIDSFFLTKGIDPGFRGESGHGLESFRIVSALRDDVKVVVIYSDETQRELFMKRLIKTNVKNLSRVKFVKSDGSHGGINRGRNISPWARDPYIPLYNPETGEFVLLPAQGGATQLDIGISKMLQDYDWGIPGLVALDRGNWPSNLDLQGGDISADQTTVYVGVQTIRNSSVPGINREDVIRQISGINGGRKVFVVPDSIDRHHDRFLIPLGKTLAGEETVALIDPVAALKILKNMSSKERWEAYYDILQHPENRTRVPNEDVLLFLNLLDRSFNFLDKNDLDSAAAKLNIREVERLNDIENRLKAEGKTVVRVPGLSPHYLPLSLMELGVYSTNVIPDIYQRQDGTWGRILYVPWSGKNSLNDAVNKFYQDLGFDVINIPAFRMSRGMGGPRCLIQVIRRPVDFEVLKMPMNPKPGKNFIKGEGTKSKDVGKKAGKNASGKNKYIKTQNRQRHNTGRSNKNRAMMAVVRVLSGNIFEISNKKGGIDLNNLNMQTSGRAVDIQAPADAAMMNRPIRVLVPKITGVGTVNLGVFLGLNKDNDAPAGQSLDFHDLAAIKEDT